MMASDIELKIVSLESYSRAIAREKYYFKELVISKLGPCFLDITWNGIVIFSFEVLILCTKCFSYHMIEIAPDKYVIYSVVLLFFNIIFSRSKQCPFKGMKIISLK